MPAVAALIVAAGRGLRAGEDAPKQYRQLGGIPVLCRTLAPFLTESRIETVLVVIGAGDRPRYDEAIGHLPGSARSRLSAPVDGGETRQDSVRAGLEALAAGGFAGRVLVHDAARPFVSAALIERALAASAQHVAAIPALAVTDTVKRIDAVGLIEETLPREQLVSVQTPQAFAFQPLLAAHRAAHAAGSSGFTDDSAIMEWAGHRVATFAGDPMNQKLTYPGDFAQAEQRFARPLVTRAGTGYDVHAFADGDHVWLGGIRIPHSRGVTAHSDGDVALHALTDAVLGALADGDIGSHFPPSDPQWRAASSERFLAFAVERVRQRGGRIDHLDLTIVCEGPKVGPHRDAIRARIAEIAGLRIDQVGVKATTSERLGFTGRGEGLAALATATIRLPEPE
ncbi:MULTISPECIES: bifunctional 2-C-methyl-D-erythritol 4-phosphate cytidylyltransferase/2-C-methyl-D-erythritol 2,4-cyclodiphosphate synthase [unclassified Bosea (in: a-proteobacteria)]|uniref:bifunctional 2-C-methyl-D-erythritol 4-phosphate cytidylyltransferase/2-C-methyl-D-erythritol 2,4-cyclodiphosphate synthase n=1 Tax=unclassified Bosea (in: a-proteobacteria) TaxID=2653178 RepID=UPI000F7650D2|nr:MULTISPECIES: bifunctional 2-C-methyl-D-erythritol 4-phosphate cytidylyltransferase/2-C-methyl-D-erythritol 2,4-cyclodiphosphate synthase [unclassified Bosea (in: a-proteobacteria)]AZO81249.1 bifunctional 2-C-methyl-D-erythritol 4-phosphate cytidylyltransferase/2-C-methyl-D-erythritol 2,4-cyclodiphosphate synthase [Bosea sp. Tri-49]RXT22396.1 bifunctional 2-C-methyl-D-erythritol 4-phosphate cytidylyltransferase/2-C-methyl-D-erythritol 2,4-cyclodiphosphate synthase [Bosea sp. Tri-39]RXT33224.1